MAEDTGKTDEQEEGTGGARDDDLDIDLGPPTPAQTQKGGCRAATVIIFVLLLAAGAFSVWYSLHLQAVRKAEMEARAQREITYKAQLGAVANNVAEAVAKAEQGHMEEALAQLKKAEDQLTTIAAQANDFDDQQWAAYAMSKKSALLDAKKIIAEEYDRYQKAVDEQLRILASKFANADLSGQTTPIGTEQPEVAPAEEPATEPSATEQPPATEEPQPATTQESQPPAEGTEAVQPETGAAPAQPR